MITRYLRAPPFEYIQAIVETQLTIVLCMAMLTLALLIVRNWQQRRLARQREFYAELLIQEILGLDVGTNPKPLIRGPRRWQIFRYRSLKSVMVRHISTVTGTEKDYLVQRYQQLGFALHDLRKIKSWFWWRRLKGLSNLNLLGLDKFAPTFHLATRDRNELVAAFAHIPLSSLRHELNQIRPLNELPVAVRSRKNVMHEILKNWCTIYGHDFLLDQIRNERDPQLLPQLIEAAAVAQSTELAEAIASKLREPYLPVEAAEQILILLRKVGDPASSAAVTPCLEHSQELIRLRAVEFLISVGNIEALRDSKIYTDTAISVRRTLQAAEESGAA